MEALRRVSREEPGARPTCYGQRYDDWGLDEDYIRAWGRWFAFLRKVYWRVDQRAWRTSGRGAAMFVANHRGFMPLDAVMHLVLILTYRRRSSPLSDHSLAAEFRSCAIF